MNKIIFWSIYGVISIFTIRFVFFALMKDVTRNWQYKVDGTDVAFGVFVSLVIGGALMPLTLLVYLFYHIFLKPMADKINEKKAR